MFRPSPALALWNWLRYISMVMWMLMGSEAQSFIARPGYSYKLFTLRQSRLSVWHTNQVRCPILWCWFGFQLSSFLLLYQNPGFYQILLLLTLWLCLVQLYVESKLWRTTRKNDKKKAPQLAYTIKFWIIIDCHSHTWNVILIKTHARSKPRPDLLPIPATIMTATFRIDDSIRMLTTCRYRAIGTFGPNCLIVIRRCKIRRMVIRRGP